MAFISDLYINNLNYIEMFAKILLAALVGGLIGFQRESSNRPAGLRTHMLVCVGSALVMVTSEYIFNNYSGQTNMDPTRLGAQVISGIGFLGAGTILRDGSTVKGLTTAAGLWAVSCIGIAIGSGFYFGGIAATLVVYFTLLLSKEWEVPFETKNSSRRIRIFAENRSGIIGDIESKFTENEVIIQSIKIVPSKNNTHIEIFLHVKYPGTTIKGKLINSLCDTEGVVKAS